MTRWTDAQLRTLALLGALLVLATLSVLVLYLGHDPSGSLFSQILQGILMIVSVLAGAHAANGGSKQTVVQQADRVEAGTVTVSKP